MTLADMFRDRKKVLIGAGILGAGIGAIALARGGSSETAAPVDPLAMAPGDYGVPSSVYNASAADDGFMDSGNAQTIVEWLQGIGGALEGLTGTVDGLSSIVGDLQGPGAIAPDPTPVAPAPVAPAPAPVPEPTAPVASTGGGGSGGGATTAPTTTLPRWTPAANAAIGSATDIQGATFAGRVALTNGQWAPIVKYKNGTSQIHPEWQRWMAANGVKKK